MIGMDVSLFGFSIGYAGWRDCAREFAVGGRRRYAGGKGGRTNGRANVTARARDRRWFPTRIECRPHHDYARLRLLGLLAEQDVPASVGNDFSDVGKWLAISRLLITYVAGPYPDGAQCRAIQAWLEAGGHWLGLHGTSGGRAERVEGVAQRRTVRTEHHAVLGCMFLTHPPICPIRVEVAECAMTRGVGASFEVTDEPILLSWWILARRRFC